MNNTIVGTTVLTNGAVSPPTGWNDNASASGSISFVEANAYEEGRGLITVYNWDSAAAVNVDLSLVASPGDIYDIHHVYDLTTLIMSGIYAGGPIALPMAAIQATSPVGFAATPMTQDETFGTFIITRTGTGPPPVQAATFDGQLDETLFFDRALNDEEIARLFNPTPKEAWVITASANVGTLGGSANVFITHIGTAGTGNLGTLALSGIVTKSDILTFNAQGTGPVGRLTGSGTVTVVGTAAHPIDGTAPIGVLAGDAIVAPVSIGTYTTDGVAVLGQLAGFATVTALDINVFNVQSTAAIGKLQPSGTVTTIILGVFPTVGLAPIGALDGLGDVTGILHPRVHVNEIVAVPFISRILNSRYDRY